jgi:hypothetical protein
MDHRRGIRTLSLCLLVLAGCTVTRIPPLPPRDRDPGAPLRGTCVTIGQVTDQRSNKAIRVEGAFNFMGTKADESQLRDLVAGEFSDAAASKGADVTSPDCIKRLDVAIQSFVWDQAWGWPVTSHRCVVGFDAALVAGETRIARRLASERTSRNPFSDVSTSKGEGIAQCLKEQLREVAGSFFDDREVRAELAAGVGTP